MSNLFISTIFGTAAGVFGTVSGCLISALIIYFGRKLKKHRFGVKKNIAYSILYEFSNGLMMAVVTFHMLPEAIDCGGMFYAIAGLITGFLFVFIIQRIIKTKTANIGILMLLGIAIHNFPEGVAIGASFANNMALAWSLLIIITIHDIPEGLSVFIPLYSGGMKIWKILLLIALSGIPAGIGAFLGNFAGALSTVFNSLSLSFAAGSMLYICISELSFEARALCNRKLITAGYISGLILGIILS